MRPTLKKDIMGSFSGGQNTFSYNPQTQIVMEERDSGFYQVLYINGKQAEAHRLDITFGSKHAQTFLYWHGNKTFELPVSYYTSIKSWASSPGFSSTQVSYYRLIGKNCYECHSSYINSQLKMTAGVIEEDLDKNSIVYGIDCERCHGPATNHVNFQLAHPESKEAKYIVSQRTLSRQQKLDECAVCHSGNDKTKEISTFKFRPGDTLANFYSPWDSYKSGGTEIDVHGNQYQLLSESKCFLKSNMLTCSTCHDPHDNASSDVKEYSAKCISCHVTTDHDFVKSASALNEIKMNCIDCHMPEQPSRAITFYKQGSTIKTAYLLRTHKIAVYNDEEKKSEKGQH